MKIITVLYDINFVTGGDYYDLVKFNYLFRSLLMNVAWFIKNNYKRGKIMSTIKKYDSSLSLDSFDIGDTYMFYINNSNIKNLPKIKESDFEPYIKSLTDVIDQNIVENNTQYLNLTRSIGVVVDKYISTNVSHIDYITVLFKTASNDYVLNKYAVNYKKTLL